MKHFNLVFDLVTVQKLP
uniref:Uncharacterized protein n=1 Tax=Anguilla anguilla TaxID=7936 RepID=A0A0E9VPZ4_ANGAN